MSARPPLNAKEGTNAARGETADRLRLIDPDIQAIRQGLFGTSRPPFATWADASTWVRRRGGREEAAGRTRAWAVYTRAVRACAALTALTGYAYELKPPILECPRELSGPPGAQAVAHVRVAPASDLARLLQTIARLAEATGFGEHALLAYVLTGTPPFLSPYRTLIRFRRLPNGTQRPVVGFELNVHDVPWNQVHTLYRGIRAAMRQHTGGVSLSTRDVRLLAAIKARGGRPARTGAGKAWDDLARQVGYSNGQAARVAYGRILARHARARTKRPSAPATR